MVIVKTILESLWFLLPGILANTIPVLVKNIKFLDYPIDFKKKLNGKRIFGDHKTFRGFFFGILTALLIVYLQKALYSVEFFRRYSLIDYSSQNIFFLGFLLGFGALFGDSLKSFFKRRLGIKPGDSWFPFDQTDFVFGMILFILPIYVPSLLQIINMFGILLILHLIAVFIGFKLGIREKPI